MKRCSLCKTWKLEDNFHKKSRSIANCGLSCWCKKCTSTKAKEQKRQYNIINPFGRKTSDKKYEKKRGLNISYRLGRSISKSMNKGLEDGKNKQHWEFLVNYTITDLKRHLKERFIEGMTWDNYGHSGWHIDHIIPQSFFKFGSYNDVEFRMCWRLENLQPLWAKDNYFKRNKLPKGNKVWEH